MMHIDGLETRITDINKENDSYKISIDGKLYKIPISLMVEFMSKDDEEFKNACLKSNEFYNIPKEHFAYACITYISEKKNHDSRFQTPLIRRHFSMLLHYELVDFEAVNKDLEIIDRVYNKVEINKKIKDLIIQGIPYNYSTLEKAIYIYIKMCQLFTYDREFFSQNQSYSKDLSYITTINVSNLEHALNLQ